MTKKFLFCLMVAIGLLPMMSLAETATVDGITWAYTVSNGEATDVKPNDGTELTENVMIPSSLNGYSVTRIGDYAFACCYDLMSIEIPFRVKSIGNYAFSGCASLTNLVVQGGVTNVGEFAFQGCGSLTRLVLPLDFGGEPVRVSETAFRDCTNVTDLAADFWILDFLPNRAGLEHFTIPEGTTMIHEGAFSWCSGLTSLELPASVKNIGNYAFAGCASLTNVVVQGGVTNIGDYAFHECGSLARLVLPLDFTCEPVNVSESAFTGCTNVTELVSDFWILHLLPNRAGLEHFTIPEGTTMIHEHAFADCGGLTSLEIPASVKSIGDRAFVGCASLTNLVIPESVVTIGEHAFDGCSGLTSVTISSHLREWALFTFPDDSGVRIIVPTRYTISLIGNNSTGVTGNLESGFVVKPSSDVTDVDVQISEDVPADKVTIMVSPSVETVKKPNGVQVWIVKGAYDITEYLTLPAADAQGVVDLTKAEVKAEIVQEVLDPQKGASFLVKATEPVLMTAPTKPGLTYTLREGASLETLTDGVSTIGDGNAWCPTITVKGGKSGFYSIKVSK